MKPIQIQFLKSFLHHKMNNSQRYFILTFLYTLFLSSNFCIAQFTHADTLRGAYSKERSWWDLKYYNLSVTFDIANQSISGVNTLLFTRNVTPDSKKNELQIDLQEPMVLDSVFEKDNAAKLSFRKDGNAYFIQNCVKNEISLYFHGSPHIAKYPPWDGGIVWAKDKNKNPWVSIACQGFGASSWFPCKDSQYDEPDSIETHFTCPATLSCISNGQFIGKKIHPNQTATYSWKVSSPINNYNIIPYIGDYVNIHEHYYGEKGLLEMDYWVLKGNEEKAKRHFKEAPKTIEALEYWFGPYPFYIDGYKLVEAPYLGMEHQSAIAYGNKFLNGYAGKDLSNTGIGLKWDFIIVHESGHEWFGNNITSKDIADMWIHESFTCYSETLFTEYWFGKEDGDKYCQGLRENIDNDKPIIGTYNVNNEGSGDMYYKGANMLHTIRTIVNNDSLFRNMLRQLNVTFYHQTVTTKDIEQFMSNYLKIDLTTIFDQYLRAQYPPILQMKNSATTLKYRWYKPVKNFDMPLIVNGNSVKCSSKWNVIEIEKDSKVQFNLNQYFLIYKEKKGKKVLTEIVN